MYVYVCMRVGIHLCLHFSHKLLNKSELFKLCACNKSKNVLRLHSFDPPWMDESHTLVPSQVGQLKTFSP